ncbi:hypothetical protein Hanom_Chr06g00537681 [Helianthus anomalus]
MESVKISTPSFISCNNTSFSVSTTGPVLGWGALLDQWLQEHQLRFQQLDIWLYKQQF